MILAKLKREDDLIGRYSIGEPSSIMGTLLPFRHWLEVRSPDERSTRLLQHCNNHVVKEVPGTPILRFTI